MVYPITVHTLIRNEDQWLWFALKSVLPWVQKVFIYDTGSNDNSIQIVKSVASPKILFAQKGQQTPDKITCLRNEMISQTTTDWFMLLDGDEVWNSPTISDFLEFTLSQPKNIQAVFLPTRNCVGDVWHYLPASFGYYEIAGKKGHLNIRAYRTGLKWEGDYPLEHYNGVNNHPDKLGYFDGYYWHLSNLKRSSKTDPVLGFRHRTVAQGTNVEKNDLPEVFFDRRPDFVPDPLSKRSFLFEAAANLRSIL